MMKEHGNKKAFPADIAGGIKKTPALRRF